MAYDPNPVSMYDSMNDSVRRYNAEMAARRARMQGFDDSRQQDALTQSAFNRDMATRNFGEEGRQFDSRMNVLREILSRRMPDFYGGGMPGPAQQGGGRGMGMTMGGGRRQQGFLPFGADEETGGQVNNYLARLMRG